MAGIKARHIRSCGGMGGEPAIMAAATRDRAAEQALGLELAKRQLGELAAISYTGAVEVHFRGGVVQLMEAKSVRLFERGEPIFCVNRVPEGQ